MYNNPSMYISSLVVNVPQSNKLTYKLSSSKETNWKENKTEFPLYALFSEFGITQASPMGNNSLLENTTMSDLALKSVENLLEINPSIHKEADFLLYCHETNEASLYITPTLKIKKLLHFKKLTPVSISYQGSTAASSSLFFLETMSDEDRISNNKKTILTTTDLICAPQIRNFFSTFPKGDASSACVISHSPGDYKILDYYQKSFPAIDQNPYEWDTHKFLLNEQNLFQEVTVGLTEFLNKNNLQPSDLNLAIPQNLSESFFQLLRGYFKNQVHLSIREKLKENNLLNSDCFYSLHELEKQNALNKGDLILLIQAGPLADFGLILIRKER
ncbi:hypothetical protein ACQKJC_12895 [Priestia koreensis]|uniref:hypothetical protein n=1 Tax=Priestia koreensis TaxID=284581 RepID=UPI003CFEE366